METLYSRVNGASFPEDFAMQLNYSRLRYKKIEHILAARVQTTINTIDTHISVASSALPFLYATIPHLITQVECAEAVALGSR